MRCTDCGRDNREGASFCDSCGAELGASDASTAADTATDISLSPDFVGRHRESGADHLMLLVVQTEQIPHEKALRSIELFGTQVIPSFRDED